MAEEQAQQAQSEQVIQEQQPQPPAQAAQPEQTTQPVQEPQQQAAVQTPVQDQPQQAPQAPAETTPEEPISQASKLDEQSIGAFLSEITPESLQEKKPDEDDIIGDSDEAWWHDRVEKPVEVLERPDQREDGKFRIRTYFPGPGGEERHQDRELSADELIERYGRATLKLDRAFRDLRKYKQQVEERPAQQRAPAQSANDLFAADFADGSDGQTTTTPQTDAPQLPADIPVQQQVYGVAQTETQPPMAQPGQPRMTPLQAMADSSARMELERSFNGSEGYQYVRQRVMQEHADKIDELQENDPEEAEKYIAKKVRADWEKHSRSYLALEAREAQDKYIQQMSQITTNLQAVHESQIAQAAEMLGERGQNLLRPIHSFYRRFYLQGVPPQNREEMRLHAFLNNPFLAAAFAFHRPNVTEAEARGYAKGFEAGKAATGKALPKLLEKHGLGGIIPARPSKDALNAQRSRTGSPPQVPAGGGATGKQPSLPTQKDHIADVDQWRLQQQQQQQR